MPADAPTLVGRGLSSRVSACTTSSWSASVSAGPSGRLIVRSDNCVATGKSAGDSPYERR